MNNNLLLILLLVMFLLLFGSWTLMRTNTSHLILQLWSNLHPISVMIICMLVMIKAFLYLILDIPCYISQNALLPYLTFFMFLILPNHYFLLRNIFAIIMIIWNFMHSCFISNIGHTMLHFSKRTFTLSNILHVPHITKSLLLVKKYFRDNNDYLEFHAFMFYVKDLTTKTVLFSG
jgi:hypothetical protein